MRSPLPFPPARLTQAADDFLAGRISRRRFLQHCSHAGISLPLLSLAGCSAPTDESESADITSEQSASQQSSDQHHFLKEVGSGFKQTKLRIVTEDTPPSVATKRLAEKEFTPLTGIEIEWDLLPLDQVLARLVADTSRASGVHDLFYLDQAWVGRFLPHTLNHFKLLSNKELAYPDYNFADILPPLIENVGSYQGQLVGIPYDIPIFIMMYRRDLFDQLKLPLPTTLAQYKQTLALIQHARLPGLFPTTMQWKSGHYSLECNMTTWLWAHGGSIFRSDGRCALDDEQAYAGLAYMMELAHFAPPEVTTWDWFGEAQSFADGRAAMYISWGEFFSSFDDDKHSKIAGLAEAAPCPQELALRPASACGFGETPGISHQGGSCLSISRYSRSPQAAWVFLQWATSSDITTRSNLTGGSASPIRFSNYSDPRTLARQRIGPGTTRHFPIVQDAILNRMGTEPHLPGWAELATQIFAVELGKMTTGQQDIETTMKNMCQAANRAVDDGE
ncbi:ABC transporter substrate-binding protein [Balneatrix alpica]|uniref:ABC transporter substrate-binding protein n=1 Tax=Balneatrix alpica TaxID=75684 RepID=A0ABV5Z7P1_9GAMM|nr:extracellular solute-binding protein [Balneatrix alpica]